jgi:hypothetical protein
VVRSFLIVANQTLGGETLVDAVRERIRQGPCEFWVVVPATPSSQLIVRRSPGGSLMPAAEPASAGRSESDSTSDQRRLDEGLARLYEAGAKADGAVGDDSPLKAIGECLTRQQFDEIILSTLPSGVSRWLRQDLPSRIQRKFGLPVTHIVSSFPEMPRFFRTPDPTRSAQKGGDSPSAPPSVDEPR